MASGEAGDAPGAQTATTDRATRAGPRYMVRLPWSGGPALPGPGWLTWRTAIPDSSIERDRKRAGSPDRPALENLPPFFMTFPWRVNRFTADGRATTLRWPRTHPP